MANKSEHSMTKGVILFYSDWRTLLGEKEVSGEMSARPARKNGSIGFYVLSSRTHQNRGSGWQMIDETVISHANLKSQSTTMIGRLYGIYSPSRQRLTREGVENQR